MAHRALGDAPHLFGGPPGRRPDPPAPRLRRQGPADLRPGDAARDRGADPRPQRVPLRALPRAGLATTAAPGSGRRAAGRPLRRPRSRASRRGARAHAHVSRRMVALRRLARRRGGRIPRGRPRGSGSGRRPGHGGGEGELAGRRGRAPCPDPRRAHPPGAEALVEASETGPRLAPNSDEGGDGRRAPRGPNRRHRRRGETRRAPVGGRRPGQGARSFHPPAPRRGSRGAAAAGVRPTLARGPT